MNINKTILTLAAAMTLCGCRHASEPTVPVATPDPDTLPQATVLIEEVPPTAEAQPASRPASRSTAPGASGTGKASPRQSSKAETIYVETEGAQGRVWGHVTMRGDRGTGTIHDWDENTLSVSVTRHGNELFAVDQNSRQYIFRLKP